MNRPELVNSVNPEYIDSVSKFLKQPDLLQPAAAAYPDYQGWLDAMPNRLETTELKSAALFVGRQAVAAIFYKISTKQPEDDLLTIENIAVDAHYRRSGMGSMLLALAEARAVQRSLMPHQFSVTDIKMDNYIARDFFGKNGYRNNGLIDIHGGAVPDVVLTKEIVGGN